VGSAGVAGNEIAGHAATLSRIAGRGHCGRTDAEAGKGTVERQPMVMQQRPAQVLAERSTVALGDVPEFVERVS
jgi:hypothetical protein